MLRHLFSRLFSRRKSGPVPTTANLGQSVPEIVPTPAPIPQEPPKPVSHPTLSQLSRKRLSECHPDLIRLVELASSRLPLAVIQGHRNEADQNAAFDRGNSKLRWPKSRHNSLPAEAVDLVPQPLDWNNISRFEELGRVVKQAALDLGIEIDWGGDWKKFRDYPHFELRRK